MSRPIAMAIDVVSIVQHFGVKNAAGTSPTDRFDRLVIALKEALSPSSGLTSDVNVGYLTSLMAKYDSSGPEWSRYAFGDTSRGYTRNLVDEGNGKSNLVSRRHRRALRGAADAMTGSWCLCGHRARVAPSTTTATPTA